MRRLAVIGVALGMLFAAGSASAASMAPLYPANGAVVTLSSSPAAFSEPIEARFTCDPSIGGIHVEESVDFLGAWRGEGARQFAAVDGVCTTDLWLIPSGSMAVDEAPHVYYWRVWQCLYAGNCEWGGRVAGSRPTWSFMVKRPEPVEPIVTPPPAPSPPLTTPATPPPSAPAVEPQPTEAQPTTPRPRRYHHFRRHHHRATTWSSS